MFSDFFQKMSTFANHHQLIIAGIIAFSITSLTWGVEKLLESYLFPNRPRLGYAAAIIIGCTLLWVTKHFTLKEW